MDISVLSNDIFFEKHPDPMWIYDRETLKFLAVNEAAIVHYGYTSDEFLTFTIADIRPADDLPALHESLLNEARGFSNAGTWRHQTKSGQILFVNIRSHDVDYANRQASMVSARDITSLIEGQADQAASAAQRDKLAQRLTDTLEDLSDGFVTLDKALVFTFLNRAGEAILGRDRATLLGKSLADAFPEVAEHPFEDKYWKALAAGQVSRFTDYYQPLSKWFEIHAHPSPDGLAVYFRDVTQQRAQENQLRLLEKAVSHLNDIVIITAGEAIDEPDGPMVVYCNDAFTRHTGYERHELLGKTPRILQGPNTQRSHLDAMRKSIEAWQPHRTELINYTKSGAEIWLEIEIVPVADATGFFTHWVSVQRDITARKRAEAAEKLNSARFDTIASAVNDVVWEWDIATDELWWSEALEARFGHEPSHIMQNISAWKQFIHPDDRNRVGAKLEAAIAACFDVWEDEYRFQRGNGTFAIVIDRGRVVRDASGDVIRMIGALMDVTERRELDMRLAHAQKLEALGKLTGGIAHDFNNLLTVIIGNTDILAQRLEPETDLHSLASLSFAAAERGAELTSRLLAFGRRQPLLPQPVDVGLMTKGLRPLLMRTLSESIDLNIILPSDPCIAQLDAGQLEAALLNLAINARDAMPNGGLLTVLTEAVWLGAEPDEVDDMPPGHFVALSVIDTGAGMDDETVQRAFEPFFTTKDAAAGSGLGLSMVYGFVKQSSGRVKISTTYGGGSTVAMYFPMSENTGAVTAKINNNEVRPENRVGGHETILVVEDDEMVRMHVTSHLAGLGYRIMSACDGDSALELLQRDIAIDLLFTDIVMPGTLSGGQLARKAKRLRPNIKILFTSGHFNHQEIVKAIPKTKVFVLNKPYRLGDLALKVRTAIDTKFDS